MDSDVECLQSLAKKLFEEFSLPDTILFLGEHRYALMFYEESTGEVGGGIYVPYVPLELSDIYE